MTFTKIAAATAFAALVAAPALAQPPQRTPEQLEAAFTAADANKDGKLTGAEYLSSLPEQIRGQVTEAMIMERRDTDKDGFVSKAEFSAPMQRPQ